MGYWGLGTKENKLAWTLIAVFVMLGVAFWIPGVLQYRRCVTQFNNCACPDFSGSGRCLSLADAANRDQLRRCSTQLQQCRKTPIVIWALGWLFLVGFSWLPCFYFCCCAKDPAYVTQQGPYDQNGVQMATGQPYGPEAHYTTHPFASHPYGPMPYYAGTQQGCPAPAYPVTQPPMGYPVNAPPQQQQQQQQQQGGAGRVPVQSF